MNIGLIGTGYWGKNLLRNLLIQDKIKNIFVLDYNIQNIKKNPNVQYFNNKKDFFSINDIDLFVISTPTKFHYEYISECLKLDKFVCVTKPFVSNIKEFLSLKKK